MQRNVGSVGVWVRAAALVVGLLLSFGGAAFGQTTYTWTGTATGVWSDSLNWDASGVPVSADTSVVRFVAADPAAFDATNDLLTTPFVLNAFELNSASTGTISVFTPGVFQLAGVAPRITVNGGGPVIFQSSAGTPGAIFDVVKSMTIGGSGSGIVTIGGATDNNVFTGSAAVTVNFATVGSAASPNLLLGNVGSWTGPLDIQSGYVRANRAGGDLFGDSTILNVAAGSTFDMNGNAEAFGGLQGAGTIVMGAAGLTFDAPGDRTWTGSIGGTGGVNQAGGGVFTLGGTNTYTGATTVSSGTIRAGAANSFSAASAVTITAGQGTLDLNGFSQTIAGLAGGTLNSNLALAGGSTLTINGSGTGTRVFSGTLSGAGGLTIGGTATQVILSGTSYTGATTVNSGTLRMNGVGLQASSGVTIATGATLDASFPTDAAWVTPLSGAGNLVKSGLGKVTFSAANAGASLAALTVNAGTVVFDDGSDNGGKLGANPALTLGSGGVTLLGNGAAASSQAFNGVTLAGGGKVSVTSGNNQNASIALGAITKRAGSTVNFTLANTGAGVASVSTTTQNGATGIVGGYATVNGTDWAVTGTGAGPFNVAPLAAASYTSNTWTAGTHTDVTSSFALPSAATTASVRFNAPAANTVTLIGTTNSVATGGLLVTPNVGAFNSTIAGGSISAPAGQELFVQQYNPSGTLTIASVIANTANVTTQSTGVVVTTGSPTVTVGSTAGLYPGMLVTAASGIPANARILSVNSPTSITLTANATASGTSLTFNGGTVLSKSGPGTLVLSGANTLTGALILNEGAVSVNTVGNIGANATDVASNSVYFNGGTLRMTGGIGPGSGIQPWIIGPQGGTIDVVGASTSTSKQGNSVFGSGTLTKVGAGSFSVGSNVSTFNGLINVNEGTIRLTSNQLRNSTGMTVASGAQLFILDTPNGPFSLAANATLALNGDGPNGTGAYRHALDEPGSSNFGWSSSVFLQTTSRLTVTTDGTLANRTASDTIVDNFPQPIVGPGSLVKDGNGTLVLANAFNRYGGAGGSTVVSNGTLMISGGNDRLPTGTTLQFGEAGSTNAGTFDLNGLSQTVAGLTSAGSGSGHKVVNNGVNASTLTVNYAGASPQTYGGQIGGGAAGGNAISLVKSGAGTLSLSGATSYTGSTTVAGGTLRVFSTSAARPYTVADGAGLTVVNPDPATPFAISTLTLGTGGTSKLGLELTGANPAIGVIDVGDAGGLFANGTVNVSVASALTLTVGQFPLVKYAGTIGGGGFGAFAAGTLSLPSRVLGNLVDNAANLSIDLNVTGVDFIKWAGTTDGNWDVNQTQNWKLNSNNASTNYLESPAPGDTVVFDASAPGTHTVNLTTTLTPSSVTVAGASDYTFAGPGKLAGATGLTKTGTGKLTVLTNNANTGPTTVGAGGTLQVGNGGTAGSLGTGGLVNDGSLIFDRADDVAIAANISGAGSLIKNGPATLSFNGSYGLGGDTTINAGTLALNGGGTYPGNIGGAGALVKGGVGTLVLTGAANHAGGTNVTGGILQVGNGGTTGSLAGSVNLAGGTSLAFNRSDDATFAGDLSGAGSLRSLGSGKTTLTGAITYTGTTVVTSGTIEFASAGDVTLGAVVSGTGTIVKSGAGRLTMLNNNNPFQGAIVINGGTVLLDDQGGGGDLSAASITVNDGGKFIFGPTGNPDFPESTDIIVNTGGVFEQQQTGGEVFGGVRLDGGTLRYTGNGTTGSATTVQGSTAAFVGYDFLSGAVVAANTGGGTGTMNGVGITKRSAGTVTFTGRTALQAAMPVNIQEGVLAFDATNLPASGAGVITLGDSGTTGVFRLAGAAPASTSRQFAINAGAIDVADPAGRLTLTLPLAGGGNLSKTGPGTLVLTVGNSFTGTTSVDAGTLRVGPGGAGGGFAVANGATLAIANGATPGVLVMPSLTLGNTNSTIAFALDSAGNPTTPLLVVSNPDGLVTGGGTHTLNVSDVQPLAVGQFTLISYVGTPITSGFGLGSLPSRTAASLVYNASNSSIDLNVTGLESTLWNGNASANWDVGTAVDVGGTRNFKLSSTAAATNFFTADRVTFDDTAAGNFAVNLTTALQPAAVTVNNDAHDYTFQGPGSITGTTGLTKSGAGTLTVLTENTYTGTTTVSAGTLQIGNGGTTGSLASPISVAAGATVTLNRADNVTYNPALSGGGAVTKTGAGTLTLGGSSPFFGTLTVDQGTVLLDDLGGGGDLNAVSIVVKDGASFVFGENGNADLPAASVVTVNAGGLFDLKQGEDFGGVVLKGGTFRMSGGARTNVNANASPSIGFIFESGTVTTAFTGAATGGGLGGNPGGLSFVSKTTPGTVTLTDGVTFTNGMSVNVLDGVLSMPLASVPTTGTLSVTLGDSQTTGTLRATGAGVAASARPFALNTGGGVIDVADPAGTLALTDVVSGNGGLTKAGAGVLVLPNVNTYTGSTAVSAGTLRVTGSIAASSAVTVNAGGKLEVAAAAQTLHALSVHDGKLEVAATAAGEARKVLTVVGDTLSVTGSGMIDVRNNGLVIDYDSASPIDTVRALLTNGRNNGWAAGTTPSIGSTEAAAGGGSFAVGYAEPSPADLADGFMGQTVDATSILVRYTLAGDADLDGKVGFSDLVKVAQNYDVMGTGTWATGDFDYDGNVGFSDLVKVAQNYDASLPAGAVPGASAGFGNDLAAAFAAVPEPSALACAAAVGAACVLSGRGRRRNGRQPR